MLSTDIAAQPLANALAAFAIQTGLQIVYVSEIIQSQQSKGVPAGSSIESALDRMLDDTGLQFELLNAHTIRIFAAPAARSTASRIVRGGARNVRTRSLRDSKLSEVLITGTRRGPYETAVPSSVAVWTPEAMEESGIKGMAEIGALTPGVEFDFDSVVSGDNVTNLVIRGVTARHGTTTGVYIDGAPIPSARSETFGRSFPVVFDLRRVDVMRGPQGVLLGQGTLGGAINFLVNEPSLTTFDGLARAEVATTESGAESYEMGAAAGGPAIPDVLGFRLSGWYRMEGGYIDRVDRFTDAMLDKNTNQILTKSARAALTWEPTRALRIMPSLTYQTTAQHAPSGFWVDWSDPASGSLRNPALVLFPAVDAFHLASVRVTAALAHADLTATTAYYGHTVTNGLDFSDEVPVDWSGATEMPYRLTQSAVSQDVRLSSNDPDAALAWTTGIFYSGDHRRETSSLQRAMEPAGDFTATVADYSRIEGFGQIGLRATRHLTVNAGLRVGRSQYAGRNELPPGSRFAADDSAVTPKFDVSYETDGGSLIYATVGKGYRGGGVYPTLAVCGDFPPGLYGPDTLWSYEIGSKTAFFGGRLHLEPSLFHIEWANSQSDVLTGHLCYPGLNIRGTAASDGFDLSARALLTERLKFAVAMAYVNARWTQTIKWNDAVIVHSGDALGGPPQVPSPWAITSYIDYEFPVTRDATVELRAEDVFHSHNPGPFITSYRESPFYLPSSRADPPTHVLNLRASMHWPTFDLSFFVNNALNSHPLLGQARGCPACGVFDYALTLRPRTTGIEATRRY